MKKKKADAAIAEHASVPRTKNWVTPNEPPSIMQYTIALHKQKSPRCKAVREIFALHAHDPEFVQRANILQRVYKRMQLLRDC
jgi:hypothetical protein